MGTSLTEVAAQNINKRKEYLKQFARVKGEIYDLHLKMYYHAEQDAALRDQTIGELQRRGTAPESGDVRSETLTCRSLTREEALTIPNLFLLDPANNEYLKGTKAQTRPKSSTVYGPALVIAIVIALVFGFFAARDYYYMKQLQDSGITTQAEITNLNMIAGSNNKNYTTSTRYEAVYKFVDAAGTQYAGKTDISYDRYRSLTVGSLLDILYVPSDPTISRVKGTTPAILGGVLGTGLFVLLALLTLFMMRSQRNSQQKLADSGQLLQAQIVETAGYKTKGGYELAVGFGCRLPDNTVLWGIESCLRNDLKNQPRPPIGASVILEYADAKQFQLL